MFLTKNLFFLRNLLLEIHNFNIFEDKLILKQNAMFGLQFFGPFKPIFLLPCSHDWPKILR